MAPVQREACVVRTHLTTNRVFPTKACIASWGRVVTVQPISREVLLLPSTRVTKWVMCACTLLLRVSSSFALRGPPGGMLNRLSGWKKYGWNHPPAHTLSSQWLSVNPSEKYAQVIKLDHFPQNFRGENFKRKCGWNQHLYSFVGFTWSIEYYLPLDPKPWKKEFLKPPSFCLIHLRFSPRKTVGAKFPGGTSDRTWAECHCSLAAIELKVWFKREIYPHGLRVPTVDGRNPAPPGM